MPMADTHSGIVCYADRTTRTGPTCNHLAGPPSQPRAPPPSPPPPAPPPIPTLTNGPDLAFRSANAGAPGAVSQSALGGSTSLLCYIYGSGTSAPTRCNTLSVSGTSLTRGTEASIATGGEFLTTTALDVSRGIVCYGRRYTQNYQQSSCGYTWYGYQCSYTTRTGTYYEGRCGVLSVSGTTISMGTTLQTYSGSRTRQWNYPSLAALGTSRAILCYTDISVHGRCVVLSVTSGTTLTQGTSYLVYASTTYWTSVAALDGSTAVVCYTHSSSRGVCRVLTASWGSVNGWELTGGAEVFFHTGYVQRISVAALDASTALVCYKDSGSTSDKHGTCNVLSVSGTTLSVGASGTFTSWSTDFISVTRLSRTDAIVCYNTNAPHDTVSLSTYGACNLLNVAGMTFAVGNDLGFSVNTGVTSVTTLGAFTFRTSGRIMTGSPGRHDLPAPHRA